VFQYTTSSTSLQKKLGVAWVWRAPSPLRCHGRPRPCHCHCGAHPLRCHCRAWPGNPWGRAAMEAV